MFGLVLTFELVLVIGLLFCVSGGVLDCFGFCFPASADVLGFVFWFRFSFRVLFVCCVL